MKWLPIKSPAGIDQYAIRSECGNYTICKVYVMGQMWYRAHKGKDFIGMSDDIAQAKKYAEDDRKAQFPEHHETNDGQ